MYRLELWFRKKEPQSVADELLGEAHARSGEWDGYTGSGGIGWRGSRLPCALQLAEPSRHPMASQRKCRPRWASRPPPASGSLGRTESSRLPHRGEQGHAIAAAPAAWRCVSQVFLNLAFARLVGQAGRQRCSRSVPPSYVMLGFVCARGACACALWPCQSCASCERGSCDGHVTWEMLLCTFGRRAAGQKPDRTRVGRRPRSSECVRTATGARHANCNSHVKLISCGRFCQTR